MIRRFTLICLAIAAFSGLRLYGIKRDAQVQDQEITLIVHDAKQAHNHAALLHAEYDLLSDPDRLKDLAGQVLKLQATDPKQYVSLADFDKRVPAVAPLPAPQEAPKQAPPPESSIEPAPAPAPPPAPAEQTKPDLVARATPVPVPLPADKPREKLAEKPSEPSNDKATQLSRVMEMLDQPTARRAPVPAAAQPQPAAVQTASAPPKPAPKPPAIAESRPVLPRPMQTASLPPALTHPIQTVAATPQAPPPYVGSALGMARIHAAPARYIAPNDEN